MIAIVYGPNLADQSRGQFCVHADGCGHDAPLDLGSCPASGWSIEVASRAQLVLDVYGDQLREGSGYEECREDIWFAVCCHALPEGDAEQLMADLAEEHEADLAHLGPQDRTEYELDRDAEIADRLDRERQADAESAREAELASEADADLEAGLVDATWDGPDVEAAREGVLELAQRMGELSALMATGMEASFNAYSAGLSSLWSMVRAGRAQVRDLAGDGIMGQGIDIGSMPGVLALDGESPEPLLAVLHSASDYTLYQHAQRSVLGFAMRLDLDIGRPLGMGDRVHREFADAHRIMRDTLRAEGIAEEAPDA